MERLKKLLGAARRLQQIVPATPAKRAAPAEEAEGGGDSSDELLEDAPPRLDDGSFECPQCQATMQTVATRGPDDPLGDYYLVGDEASCKYCHERIPALDEK